MFEPQFRLRPCGLENPAFLPVPVFPSWCLRCIRFDLSNRGPSGRSADTKASLFLLWSRRYWTGATSGNGEHSIIFGRVAKGIRGEDSVTINYSILESSLLHRLDIADQFARATFKSLGMGVNATLNEFQVLAIISVGPRLRMCDVAELAGLGRAAFSTTFGLLEGRGLVKRHFQTHDRRMQTCSLTEAGVAVLACATTVWHEVEMKLAGRLGSSKDREDLLVMLSRLA